MLEQRPLREADGPQHKGSELKRTSNPKQRLADTVLLVDCIDCSKSLQWEEVKHTARCQGRKHLLFQMRLSVAQEHLLLRQHVPLLEHLGVNGMSSDESDIDNASDAGLQARCPIYQVIMPVWRATEFPSDGLSVGLVIYLINPSMFMHNFLIWSGTTLYPTLFYISVVAATAK
ncbi:hypothetical protein BDN71DRAFT_1437256 [Pleurotus eryngii]|uniref:Uncharacterized protein n=1 Tax=Pleurotus eryngii TaxID=5323 RepID=A0A9P5ZGW6_PLEER|nr:hypothetical protein BDN71DRAFT_1437256 [Pleurotus eryngii]